MTDMLARALEGVLAMLDTERRPWIVGVARLAGVPLDEPALDVDTVSAVLEIATSTVQFPSGPVEFVPGDVERVRVPDYEVITLSSADAPHLELKMGVGIAGIAAVALTRSDVFDDGSRHPSSVLLTDAESVVADTYTLSIASALELGYAGRIDYAFTITHDGAGEGLSVFALDEEIGKPVKIASDGHQVGPTFAHIEYSAEEKTPREAHNEVHRMASDLLGRFGSEMQLVTLLDGDVEGYEDDPLNAHAPERQSRARRG